MSQDKFTATWVSHSSISDFLTCPRAYYLKNVYKDPKTGHKIQVISPPLSLGQAVHNVLDSLSGLSKDDRFKKPLSVMFEAEWAKMSGERGGFVNDDQEYQYKKRGLKMMTNVYNNPGPLKNLAVKIKQDLPFYWLDEEENIILCGKLDWLEYFPDDDSVHIIDFKTGKSKENADSLQLPIYNLLTTNCQERKVAKASYWYIENDTIPKEKILPDLKKSEEKVLAIAKRIKLARQLKKFDCPSGEGGCRSCQELERVIKGEGKLVGQDDHYRDVYILPEDDDSKKSEIL
jgi:CRISPR/Cas system-associated exonuclease Cas4 (RecB family)